MNPIEPFFSEMEDYIQDSRDKLASGRDIDMLGLDIKVEALCNMVLDMPQPDRVRYEPKLQHLLEGLNALGEELREKMGGVSEHKRAHAAYKTADSRDNFGQRQKNGEDDKK